MKSIFEPELALLVGLQVVSSKEGGEGGGNFLTRFFCLDFKLMPALEQSGILWEVTKGAKPGGSGPGGQVRGAKSGGPSPGGQVRGRASPRGAKPRVLG